jgi:multidrug efflux pump subunit AcrA (membrane-fusion protein)
VQLAIALVVAIGALVLLLWSPFGTRQPAGATKVERPNAVVQLAGTGSIKVEADTPLQKKLEIADAKQEKLAAPILNVTGSVVARLAPGKDPAQDRWQFNSPDVLSAYTDWQKSRIDVEFNQEQLAKIRKLNKERVDFQTQETKRLRKLEGIGTDSKKDLAAAETALIQAQIQGQKEVYEAENNVRVAQRARAALERQLQQAGVDPELLARSSDGSAIVVADVPETKLNYAREGQACTARFFGLPDMVFPGRVGSLAPTLSRERRTLRVQFVLDDPNGRLRPGMFAEIGLGTDPRESILVPADAVIHVGRSDYVLVGEGPGTWKITEVKVGELHGRRVEIVEGLRPGQKVIGSGAILLKPFVVQSLQAQKSAETAQP